VTHPLIERARIEAAMQKLSRDIAAMPLAEQLRLAADLLEDVRADQRQFARAIALHVARDLAKQIGAAR